MLTIINKAEMELFNKYINYPYELPKELDVVDAREAKITVAEVKTTNFIKSKPKKPEKPDIHHNGLHRQKCKGKNIRNWICGVFNTKMHED